MVYFHPQNLDNQQFESQGIWEATPRPTGRPVEVLYNGSGLHLIAGPVPVIDISRSINRNSAGVAESYTTKIDIAGKIVRTGVDRIQLSSEENGELVVDPDTGKVIVNNSGFTPGIGPVLQGIKEMQDLFSPSRSDQNAANQGSIQDLGVLEVRCSSTAGQIDSLFLASGVKVLDLSFSKSDDNWTFTADYNISLEYSEPSIFNNGHYVRDTSDSWTVEPIEDYSYQEFYTNVSQRSEHHNPRLLPEAATQNTRVPRFYVGQDSIGDMPISFINMPQYRITRKVSAIGLPSGTGSYAGNTAYLNARAWVLERLGTAFDPSFPQQGSGFVSFNYNNGAIPRGVELYNHVRNTSFSMTDGTYEVNDTWLAMPTGMAYTEDYTIESSTDDRFVKTVRVQGQIKGLSITKIKAQSGDPFYEIIDASGLINLSGSMDNMSDGNLRTQYQLLDNTINNSPNYLSKTTQIYNSSKYENAVSGWINDIKPYIYRRACLATNSPDRKDDYIDPNLITTQQNKTTLPKNPIYCKERVLNPNPISTTEGLDPRKGTISYSMEFSNKLSLITGVITENISINDTGPTDVIGEAFIIGRRLGPILQSLNAKTSTRKDISIEITVLPPSSINGMMMTSQQCPLYTGGSIYHQIQTIVEGFKPFGARQEAFGSLTRNAIPGQVYVSQDNQNWNPAEGRYSRNVSWVYQQCNNSKNYLDH